MKFNFRGRRKRKELLIIIIRRNRNRDCESRPNKKPTRHFQDHRIFRQVSITQKSALMSRNFLGSCNYGVRNDFPSLFGFFITPLGWRSRKQSSTKSLETDPQRLHSNDNRTLNLKIIVRVLE